MAPAATPSAVRRARQSAEIIRSFPVLAELEAEVHENLRELDFGIFEGLSRAHAVALAATRMTCLRQVVDDRQLAVLRILTGRRRSLGEDRSRMVSRLH